MKKSILLWGMVGIIWVGLLSVIVFMIYNPMNNKKEKNKEINYEEFGKYIALQDVPQDYSLEQALNDGCFIISHNQVYNMKKLEDFLGNTEMSNKNRFSDLIRIIQYTKEGDMIIIDVCYQQDQNTYVVAIDNTRDRFTAKENKKITIKNDFPSNFYGITKTEDKEYTKLELALYKQQTETYKNYEIVSYLKDTKINELGPNFIGIVEKVNKKSVLVKVDNKKENNSSSDRYTFDISEEMELKEEDRVMVTYTGVIWETYPARINVTKIEKVEE